ncbi:MAG: hypothetical protein ABW026_06435 [Microvirga sp.]
MSESHTAPRGYRAYVVGPQGRITDVHELTCETDEQAIRAARAYVDGVAIELWNSGRKVSVLRPTDPPEGSLARGVLYGLPVRREP